MRLSHALGGVTAIGIDSSAFISYAEATPAHIRALTRIFGHIESGELQGYTTTVTLPEVLLRARQDTDKKTEDEYRVLLFAPGIRLIPVDLPIAETATNLRSRYNLKTPDALQVATAIEAGCQAFLTGDTALSRVAEIRVLVLSQLTV